MQNLCQLKVGWDEKILENQQNWVCWQNKLPKLENIKASRHYKQDNLRNVMKAEVHYASKGYSLLSYDRKV